MGKLMKKSHGFTLIELMIVVVIIGILAAVGLPSYNAYIVESNRRNATGELVSLEARMQRFYANSGRTYTGANVSLGLSAATTDSADNNEYNYNVVIPAAGQSFSLTATAIAGGSQANDTGCTTLTITNTGAKTPAVCW